MPSLFNRKLLLAAQTVTVLNLNLISNCVNGLVLQTTFTKFKASSAPEADKQTKEFQDESVTDAHAHEKS